MILRFRWRSFFFPLLILFLAGVLNWHQRWNLSTDADRIATALEQQDMDVLETYISEDYSDSFGLTRDQLIRLGRRYLPQETLQISVTDMSVPLLPLVDRITGTRPLVVIKGEASYSIGGTEIGVSNYPFELRMEMERSVGSWQVASLLPTTPRREFRSRTR